MKPNCNMKEIEKLFCTCTPEELAISLDHVLFTATISYLDPTGGGSNDEIINDVYNVRFLLESLRECCKSSE